MSRAGALPVDPSNAAALEAWDGSEGEYWAENERIYEGSLSRYRQAFFAAASIGETDRVLDIGCGTGQTTRHAAALARRGSALGVDLSSQMLDVARRRAAEEGIANATFLQADAQVHAFEPGRFDVAISRTGAMFFGDPVAAFINTRRALRAGARLVLLVWKPLGENHWVRDFFAALTGGGAVPSPPPHAPGPFSLADPDHDRSLLTAAGFHDVGFEAAAELMWFGDTVDEAFRFIRGLGLTVSMLRGLDQPAHERAVEALRTTIEAHLTADGVLYPSAAWLITARC